MLSIDGERSFGTIAALERPEHVVRARRIDGDMLGARGRIRSERRRGIGPTPRGRAPPPRQNAHSVRRTLPRASCRAGRAVRCADARPARLREVPSRRRRQAHEAPAQQAAYITTLEPEFHALSDDELRAKTAEFRERLDNGEALDELLFEAYAAVREARLRESNQRMFDVQLMGGIVLHEGDVAEMKTGEGKTFVASLALYLNALPTVTTYDGRTLGQGVHLVTVNDYLAQRDAEWNRPSTSGSA